jgi:hypothetical protein
MYNHETSHITSVSVMNSTLVVIFKHIIYDERIRNSMTSDNSVIGGESGYSLARNKW